MALDAQAGHGPVGDEVFREALACDQLFEQHREQAVRSSQDVVAASLRLVEEYHLRFNAWAAYLGVFAEERASLDWRLRRAADIRDLICNLLRLLRDALAEAIGQLSAASSLPGPPDVTTSSHMAMEGCLERMERLGTTIRQASVASLISRIERFNRTKGAASHERLEMLAKTCIQFLHSHATPSLQAHLVHTVVSRCDRLTYLKEHQRRLAARNRVVAQTPMQQQLEEVPEEICERTEFAEAAPRPLPTPQKDAVQMADSVTDASTLYTTNLREAFRQETQPQRKPVPSVRSIASSVPFGTVNYPKPPKVPPTGGAVCPWCFCPLRHRETEVLQWRKHVHYDLKPYVCVAESCSQPIQEFSSFKEWRGHMEAGHGKAWAERIHPPMVWTCDIDHPVVEPFQTPESLSRHLDENHTARFTDSQMRRLVLRSSTRKKRERGQCPLCCHDVRTAQHAKKATASQGLKHGDSAKSVATQLMESRKRPRDEQEPPRPPGKRAVRFAPSATAGPAKHRESRHGTNSPDDEYLSESAADPQAAVASDDDTLSRTMAKHFAAHLQALSFLSLRLLDLASAEESLETTQAELAGSATDAGDIDDDDRSQGRHSGIDSSIDRTSLDFGTNSSRDDGDQDIELPLSTLSLDTELEQVVMKAHSAQLETCPELSPCMGPGMIDRADLDNFWNLPRTGPEPSMVALRNFPRVELDAADHDFWTED